jgi:E3 ubiquitin-protein ligase HUWE1
MPQHCRLLNGITDLPVDEWRAHTSFTGGDHPQVEAWFWEAVASFSQTERAGLLQFATGCSTLPPEGFSGLRGLDEGSNSFTVSVSAGVDEDALPTASTCFNLLKIPRYSSSQLLRAKLLLAIRYGSEGFTFA